MEEIRTDEGVKQEVNKLKTQIQRLNNIVWVVGIVAVVFGVSGAFGYNMLVKAQENLATLRGQVEKLNRQANNIVENLDIKEQEIKKNLEKKEGEIKKDLQVNLNYDFDKKRSELDNHLNKKRSELVKHFDQYIKYDDEITIRLKHDKHLLYGAYGNYNSQLRTIEMGEIPKLHGQKDQAIWQIIPSIE